MPLALPQIWRCWSRRPTRVCNPHSAAPTLPSERLHLPDRSSSNCVSGLPPESNEKATAQSKTTPRAADESVQGVNVRLN